MKKKKKKNKRHIGLKTLWEKGKWLVTGNFSFSHNVFHSYIFLLRQNAALCANGLIFTMKCVKPLFPQTITQIRIATFFFLTRGRWWGGGKGERGVEAKYIGGSEKHLRVVLYQASCQLMRIHLLTLSQTTDSTKLKVFADDNFKVDENGRKFSKRVENTVGKEKLLVTSNFSFSYSVLKRPLLQTSKNQGLFWKGLSAKF